MLFFQVSSGQIGLKKTERVRHPDNTHSSLALLLDNLIAERLHSSPMHLRPEMMFGMVAIVKPCPVIQLAVSAHAPCNRLVGIAPVMPVVAVQIRKAVAKIPKRQKKTDVMPVQNTEDHKSYYKTRQFKHSPKRLARIFPF